MAQIFKIEPHVRSMIDDDGAVLLDLRVGKYYSLNGVAAQIWIKAEEGHEENAIVEHIQGLYGIDKERIQQDIQAFVSGLSRKGLVHG